MRIWWWGVQRTNASSIKRKVASIETMFCIANGNWKGVLTQAALMKRALMVLSVKAYAHIHGPGHRAVCNITFVQCGMPHLHLTITAIDGQPFMTQQLNLHGM